MARKVNKQANNKTAEPSSDQLQHQERTAGTEALLEFVQKEFVAQSDSLSKVVRTVVGVILGTIWAICYKEKALEIPNIWILFSLISSLLFFLVELCHYLCDSIFYHGKSDKINEEWLQLNESRLKQHQNDIQMHSKWSFRFLMAKAILALLVSTVFIIGVITLYANPIQGAKSVTNKHNVIKTKHKKVIHSPIDSTRTINKIKTTEL